MNIFIIPSWYPDKDNPIAGIFFKEQAIALGECRPDWNIAISLCGYGKYTLSLKHPLPGLKLSAKYLLSKKEKKLQLLHNVVEYHALALEWSSKMLKASSNAPLRATEINLKKAVADFGHIDVIHAHVSYPAGWFAMHLSKETGIPYVITEHMSPFPFPSLLKGDGSLDAKVRLPLENADAVIAVSPSLVKRMQSFGIRNIRYIPNVIDERVFKPVGEAAVARPFTFFTLGSMTQQKGIPDLLLSIDKLFKKIPPEDRGTIQFRIGGAGPEKKTYEQMANNLGVSNNIRWLGQLNREQARREYQQCDCFILTSHHETFGVVYAEATACGKPVIATRCGGPEVIVTPENGILVNVGNIGQIADAMRKMIDTAHGFDAKKIRGQFVERFSREPVVSQLEKIYSMVQESRL